MAEILRVNEKTFRKAVKEQNLPFHRIGNSKRFNPEKVLARIEAVEASQKVEKKASKKRYDLHEGDYSEFYDVLGLNK